MADATMELVERIEGMIDTSASYDAMGITRVCRAAMSEAHDAGHALGVASERERGSNLRRQFSRAVWMDDEFLLEMCTRSADGKWRFTYQGSEPDEHGVCNLIVTRHEDDIVATERERCAKVVENRAGADAYADDNRPCGPCCTLNAAAIRAGEARG